MHDTVFYCVANMPGAVPHTSTYALTNATLPYVVALAQKGWRDALRAVAALVHGLSDSEGQLGERGGRGGARHRRRGVGGAAGLRWGDWPAGGPAGTMAGEEVSMAHDGRARPR